MTQGRTFTRAKFQEANFLQKIHFAYLVAKYIKEHPQEKRIYIASIKEKESIFSEVDVKFVPKKQAGLVFNFSFNDLGAKLAALFDDKDKETLKNFEDIKIYELIIKAIKRIKGDTYKPAKMEEVAEFFYRLHCLRTKNFNELALKRALVKAQESKNSLDGAKEIVYLQEESAGRPRKNDLKQEITEFPTFDEVFSNQNKEAPASIARENIGDVNDEKVNENSKNIEDMQYISKAKIEMFIKEITVPKDFDAFSARLFLLFSNIKRFSPLVERKRYSSKLMNAIKEYKKTGEIKSDFLHAIHNKKMKRLMAQAYFKGIASLTTSIEEITTIIDELEKPNNSFSYLSKRIGLIKKSKNHHSQGDKEVSGTWVAILSTLEKKRINLYIDQENKAAKRKEKEKKSHWSNALVKSLPEIKKKFSQKVSSANLPRLMLGIIFFTAHRKIDLTFLTRLTGSRQEKCAAVNAYLDYVLGNIVTLEKLQELKNNLLAMQGEINFFKRRTGLIQFSIHNHRWKNESNNEVEKVSGTWVKAMQKIEEKYLQFSVPPKDKIEEHNSYNQEKRLKSIEIQSNLLNAQRIKESQDGQVNLLPSTAAKRG